MQAQPAEITVYDQDMRIQVRDDARQRIGIAEVDVAQRPTRVTIEIDGEDARELFLAWDGAVDDSGSLKACIVCGCNALFRARSFPRITLFVVPLAFAGAVVAAIGYAQNPWVLAMLVAVLVTDLGIFLFSHRQLVCYRCRSRYSSVPIARYHRDWDRITAEKYPAEQPSLTQNYPDRRAQVAQTIT